MATVNPIVLVLLGCLLDGTLTNPPCYGYGCHHPPTHLFLPALPGKIPTCAKNGRTFCEKIETYPTKLIQHLIERWEYDLGSLFVNDKDVRFPRNFTRPRPVYGPPSYHSYSFTEASPAFFQTPPPLQYHNFNSISFNQNQGGYPNRQYSLGHPSLNFNENSESIYSAILQTNDHWWKRHARSLRKKRQISAVTLCPTTSMLLMPKAAMNTQSEWRYVVNLEGRNYTQFIRTEICLSKICNGICTLPNGYTSNCEQQFVQKRLVALGGNGQLYTDLFWFPHCCICQIMPTDF